jgi:4-coumarate--CoA ligase
VTTIHRSPRPEVVIPEVAITDFVLERADAHADRIALVDGTTGRSYSYGALSEAIDRFAGGLAARGVGPGSTVAVMAPNLPEYAVAFHGTTRAGAVVTTVNPTYGPDEVAFQLADADADLLVTVPSFLDTARAAAAGTGVRELVVIGDADGADGVTPFVELLAADPLEQVAVTGDAVATLPYSSGTTGLPKGVMLTHGNLVANLAQVGDHLDIGDDEVYIATLPFFHIYGMNVIMNDGLRRGATLVTMPRFDLVEFLALAQRHGATRLYVVPPIVLALAKHPVVEQYNLSSVRSLLSGAAPLGPDLAREAADRLGVPVVQGYGMTELSPVSHALPFDEDRPGSIGTLVTGTEARVVDPDTGDDRGVGEDGEIWVRGPQVMLGYLNNAEATAATIDADGWLHTGDIGHVDAEGYWYVVDRLKELIKVKGFQVPPAELEDLLVSHPKVADVAVVGVPDAEAGERPKAFVVVQPDVDCTADELRAFVAEHVATYKRIHDVAFVDTIPKSPSGKILRRLLRDS